MKLLLWFWLLTKRLYKKVTFLMILLLIPALVLGYTAAAGEESGMITVALAQEGDDPLAAELMTQLSSDGQLILFRRCETSEQAQSLIWGGKADMAWIFRADLSDAVADFAKQPVERNAVATVVVREDNVTYRLARERLSGIIMRQVSYRLYVAYIRENVPELSNVSDETLMEYYNNQEIAEDLFTYDETALATKDSPQSHYLTAPIRGLLAVMILLCGMATAMYYMQDSKRGTFGWVSMRRMPLVELGCQLVSLVNVMAVVVVTLWLNNQCGKWFLELSAAVVYCLCCAAFSMLLRRLCRSVRVLGTLLPLLVVGMLLVCPVFLDLGKLRFLQLLFPPTYYIHAGYNPMYLAYMLLHTGVCLAAYTLLAKIRKFSA